MKLDELLGSEITDCTCGTVHRIPTREIHLQPGSLDAGDVQDLIQRKATEEEPGAFEVLMPVNIR